MPLPFEAEERLSELGAASGDFALFGIFLNPKTGEMGTYSSHGMEPGAVLGFLQRAVEKMVIAAANNELEFIGGEDAQTVHSQDATRGGKSGIIH